MLTKIKKLICENKNIALVGHIMPDGDTIGSCLALGYALESQGKNVELFCQDEIPDNLCFLKGCDKFHNEIISCNYCFDLVIALDCSDPERLGIFYKLLETSNQTINIDHHISNTKFALVNWVDPTAAATCELVYELIKNLNIPINMGIANAIYTGISTDTSNFSYSNTTSKTHIIAAELLETGVQPEEMSMNIYKNNSIERVKLISKAIDTIELHEDGCISTMEITRDMLIEVGVHEKESSGMVNYAKDIKGVELALLFKEQEDGQIKVSMRSKKIVDCNELASLFGGGGHARAAGCTINTTLYNAKKIVLEEAKSFLKG